MNRSGASLAPCQRIVERFRDARPRVRALDVGCGPGAGLLGSSRSLFRRRAPPTRAAPGGSRSKGSLRTQGRGRRVRLPGLRGKAAGPRDIGRRVPRHRRTPDRERALQLMRFREADAARQGVRASAPCLSRTPFPTLRSTPKKKCTMQIPIDRPRFVADVNERLGSRTTSLLFLPPYARGRRAGEPRSAGCGAARQRAA